MSTLNELSRRIFAAFALRGLKYLNAVESPELVPYVDWLCQEMQLFAEGRRRRLMISLPPRHLKTSLSICLVAWILGLLPWAKILVLSHSEKLAEKFAFAVRELMTSPFYLRTFPTRLAPNRSTLMDFVTTARGGLYSASVNGSVTGIGADFIIVDDPMQIRHWDDLARMNALYDSFTNEVMTRLNNPSSGCVLVIGHRLNAEDLFGRLRNDGEWKHIVLPLIAPRDCAYALPDGTSWHSEEGDLLMPDAFSKSNIRDLKRAKAPGFEVLQQQNPGKAKFRRVKADHFLTFYPQSLGPKGVVLSIDPGQGRTSYSVIQAWTMENERYVLLDQWRAQASYPNFYHNVLRFIRLYRPGVVLVECNAHGAALVDELSHRGSIQVIPINPSENKLARTKRLFAEVRRRKVTVPIDAGWVQDLIEEFTLYPNGRNDDQIDAAGQFVDWIRRNSLPPAPSTRTLGALVTASQLTGNWPSGADSSGTIVTSNAPGAALARHIPFRRRY